MPRSSLDYSHHCVRRAYARCRLSVPGREIIKLHFSDIMSRARILQSNAKPQGRKTWLNVPDKSPSSPGASPGRRHGVSGQRRRREGGRGVAGRDWRPRRPTPTEKRSDARQTPFTPVGPSPLSPAFGGVSQGRASGGRLDTGRREMVNNASPNTCKLCFAKFRGRLLDWDRMEWTVKVYICSFSLLDPEGSELELLSVVPYKVRHPRLKYVNNNKVQT